MQQLFPAMIAIKTSLCLKIAFFTDAMRISFTAHLVPGHLIYRSICDLRNYGECETQTPIN